MSEIPEDILKEARKELARKGQEAFKSKTTPEERQAWRKKGGEKNRIKWQKIRDEKKEVDE